MRRQPAAALLLGLLSVTLIGCRHLPAPPQALARTKRFTLTADDLARWTPVLKSKGRGKGVRRGSDPRAALLRRVALIRIVLEDGGHLLDDSRRAVLARDLADAEVRRLYEREVLRPQVDVSLDDARRIFEEHRDGYRKARGVRSLQIFTWAPTDLPELRARKQRLLEELCASIDSKESFEEAAWQHSDATSAVWSGHIGTMLENQLGEPLRSVLFSSEPGITPVIESDDGLFLFWVVGFVPAKDNRFEDVAPGIVNRLERQRLDRLREEAVEQILAGLELADPPPADQLAPAARYRGRVLSLADLELDIPSRSGIRARIIARAMHEQLVSRGVSIPEPPPEQLDWRLYHEIWPLMVERWQDSETEADDATPEAETAAAGTVSKGIQRWSFGLLVINGCSTQRELFQTFRSLHELGPDADLEALANHLRVSWGLQPTVRSYDRITAPEAAALGPEIHTTLKRRLEVGELSKPMHLADRNQVVVVELEAREVDHVASDAAGQQAETMRATREAEEQLEHHLLASNSFEMLKRRP